MSVPLPDKSHYYLGKLCKRGHGWRGGNQSLRRQYDRTCVVCDQERSLRRSSERQVHHRAELDRIKVSRGCADCGYNAHAAALDFDHLPGSQKRIGVARMHAWFRWDDVLEEIEKCEVVCANCHRVRTAHRRVEKRI